jgi:hypothetical protein
LVYRRIGLFAAVHESGIAKAAQVATEMALNVLAYNIKRVMMIIGVAGMLEAMWA